MSAEITLYPPSYQAPYNGAPYEAPGTIHPFPDSEYDPSINTAPIADIADKLGKLTCIKEFVAQDPTTHRLRSRKVATMGVKTAGVAAEYELRVTEPAYVEEDDPQFIALLPGFSESPNAGTARQFHDHMAEAFPASTIVSISTEGVNDYCRNLSPVKALCNNFETMAKGRLNLLQHMTDGAPVDLVGVSMGSKISHEIALQNLNKKRVEIDQVGYHDPALVTPENTFTDMGLLFPAHVTVDILREAARHPIQAARAIEGYMIFNPLRAATRVAALTGNALALFEGTPLDEIEAVADSHQVRVVAGGKDPLFQREMWEDIERRHPDNVQVMVNEDSGHASIINAHQAALDMKTVFETARQKV